MRNANMVYWNGWDIRALDVTTMKEDLVSWGLEMSFAGAVSRDIIRARNFEVGHDPRSKGGNKANACAENTSMGYTLEDLFDGLYMLLEDVKGPFLGYHWSHLPDTLYLHLG
jgi:hypothetical protein